MKITLAHPFSFPDVCRGAERYLEDLSWYLAGCGHDVRIVTGTTGVPSRERRPDGVLVERRRFVAPRRLERRGVGAEETFGLVALPSLVRRADDIVHALVPSAVLAARLVRRRTVFTVLGHPTAADLAAQPAAGRLTRRAARAATAVTAFSEASAAAVHAHLGRVTRSLSPGVRLDRFPADGQPGPGPPRILFAGDAADPRKNLGLLVEAFALVRRRHPEAILHLSGSADHGALLDRLGTPPETLKAIEDGGPAFDELPVRYRQATVTVLPARDEAFGIALIESLASGTPIVCTAAGGMPEIADDVTVSRTFPPGDVAALASAIIDTIEVAGRPETAARCADHARRWSWADAIGPAHEAFYEELAG